VDASGVQFATVDGFQGREADVVIFSCVRCGRLANAFAWMHAGTSVTIWPKEAQALSFNMCELVAPT
jgi:hypothetical protein